MSDTMQTTSSGQDPIDLSRQNSWRALLRWGGFLLAVSILFSVVASVSDLRDIDPIFIPTTVLLIVGCLIVGYTAGKLLTIRRLQRD
jgi:hypothetical protein